MVEGVGKMKRGVKRGGGKRKRERRRGKGNGGGCGCRSGKEPGKTE